MTPVKDPQQSRSQMSENFNPNISISNPTLKKSNSPAINSLKSKKSASKNPEKIRPFPNTVQERKFVVCKKSSKRTNYPVAVSCKCKERTGNGKKCPCVAYENLRASQDEFFRNKERFSDESKNEEKPESAEEEEKATEASEEQEENGIAATQLENQEIDEFGSDEVGSSKVRKIKHGLLEQARQSIPEPGSGRVMHLVRAFESILAIPVANDSKEKENEDEKIPLKWALPGFQPKASESEVSSCSFSLADIFFSKNFDKDSRVDSSTDSSKGSINSRTSGEGCRSRRNSSESSGRAGGRKWEKQLKVTSQQPFKLRTEQRGRGKKEEFHKKVEEMIIEEKKQRIPIAQGLPWTTDQPECLVKPPVKENTRPIDWVLHSDMRAVERAEFDHQVAEKLSLMEQYIWERERQQKLEEEEEIRRLKKELVPRAQPMPYFDRPFIPKRSLKHPTIPREPKFHFHHHKKIRCISLSDINFCQKEQ